MLKQAKRTQRIVLVDDEPDFHAVVRDWLTPRYEFVSLLSGEGLLDELSALEPDLLILDVRLPGDDGFKLCRKIRADGRFDTLPVLFLTASHTDNDFLLGFEVGGTGYLTKPIDRKELLAKIRGLTEEAPKS